MDIFTQEPSDKRFLEDITVDEVAQGVYIQIDLRMLKAKRTPNSQKKKMLNGDLKGRPEE